jgi:hypothetical protein
MTLTGVSRSIKILISNRKLTTFYRNMSSFPPKCIKIDRFKGVTVDLTFVSKELIPEDPTSFKQVLECE